MNSKYYSTCKKCHRKIRPGEPIIHEGESWVHKDCPNGFEMKSQAISHRIYTVVPPLSSERVDLAAAIALAERDKPLSTPLPIPKFEPSAYQRAVFDFISNGHGHAVVEAMAGSGKTTTIVEALSLTPTDAKVAFVAFNKHIATELKLRSPDHVHVSTLHSLGLSNLRKALGKVDVDDDKLSYIMDEFWGVGRDVEYNERIANKVKRSVMRKLVSLTKAILVDYTDCNAVQEAADRYGVELNSETDEILGLLPTVMQRSVEQTKIVDYDDMIYLPVKLNLELEKFDWLFVDECQDLNASQIQFILHSIASHGRIIAVGDRAQSLYGFRGADTEAIPRLIRELNATVLPLSITYRCPLSHVKLAQRIVPTLEARPNAPEGTVTELFEDKLAGVVKPGDMVICRTNAPLISHAFDVIRRGEKAVVRGRDIGASLVSLVERFHAESLDELHSRLNEYHHREYSRLIERGKELAAESVTDRVEVIRAVSEDCLTVYELLRKLESLFSDERVGVVFSSVHRAKGLEAERVFILHPELMPHPKAKQDWERVQEMNCLYVAETRSKSELYFVR